LTVLLRLAYLGVTNVFMLLRLPPMSNLRGFRTRPLVLTWASMRPARIR
jgi:hypothetical protein